MLSNALHKLVHEVSSTQRLYARAILHFVRRVLSTAGSGLNQSTVSRSAYNSIVYHNIMSSTAATTASSSNATDLIEREVNILHSASVQPATPTRSSSAPTGRTKFNNSKNNNNNTSGSAPSAGDSSSSNPLSRSLDGPIRRNSASDLTLMGGRRSPVKESQSHHAARHTMKSVAAGGEVAGVGEGEEGDSKEGGGDSVHIVLPVEESLEVRIQRETELLQDINTVNDKRADGSSDIAGAVDSRLPKQWMCMNQVQLIPFVNLGGSGVYCSADFITGLVEMNRAMHCTSGSTINDSSAVGAGHGNDGDRNDLSDEVRRKNLFGSDQIIS